MKRAIGVLAILTVGGALGIGLDRLWLAAHQAPPAEVGTTVSVNPPGKEEREPRPDPDFSLPETGEILDLALLDLFTNPRHREEALALLNDIPSEPSGTPRPPLDAVVIDSRQAPPGYFPHVPGIPVVVLNRGQGPALRVGEIGIDVSQFQIRPDGSVEIELSGSSYGYTGNAFTYRAFKESGRWRVEYMHSEYDH